MLPHHRISFFASLLLAGCGGSGGGGGSSNGPPQPPQLTPIALQVDEDTAVTAQLTSQDPDGDVVSYQKTTDVQHGTLVIAAQGALNYIPAANFNGTDTFTVQATDARGNTASSSFVITVRAVNDAPVFGASPLAFVEDSPDYAQFTVTDAESDTIVLSLGEGASHGVVALQTGMEFAYAPAANFFGTDSFTVVATDSAGATTTGTITLTVAARPDPPTAVADKLRVPATAASLDVLANDFDIDAEPITAVTILTQPPGGTVAVTGGNQVMFTPSDGFRGPTSFDYRISDASGATSNATVKLLVGDFPEVLFLSRRSNRAQVFLYDGLDTTVVTAAGSVFTGFDSLSVSDDGRYVAYLALFASTDGMVVQVVDLQNLGTVKCIHDTPYGSGNPKPVAKLSPDGAYASVLDWSVVTCVAGCNSTTILSSKRTSDARRILGLDKASGIYPTSPGLFNPVTNELYFQANVSTAIPPSPTASTFSTLFAGASAEGSTITQLGASYPPGFGSGIDLRVTPDGTRVVHAVVTPGPTTGNLLVNDRNMSTVYYVNRQFLDGEFPTPYEYDMRPDGTSVCMRVNAQGSASTGPGRIWVAPLVAGVGATAVTPTRDYNFDCRWVSDNKTIVYLSADTGDKVEPWRVDTTQPNVVARLREPLTGTEELDYLALAKQSTTAIIGIKPNASGAPVFYRARVDAPGTSTRFGSPGVSSANAKFSISPDGNWFAYLKDEPSSSNPSTTIKNLHLLSTRVADHDISVSEEADVEGIAQFQFRPSP